MVHVQATFTNPDTGKAIESTIPAKVIMARLPDKTLLDFGDFVETVNTVGLPRYAKQAIDDEFGRWVKVHSQSNPLPICTRPRVLVKGKAA